MCEQEKDMRVWGTKWWVIGSDSVLSLTWHVYRTCALSDSYSHLALSYISCENTEFWLLFVWNYWLLHNLLIKVNTQAFLFTVREYPDKPALTTASLPTACLLNDLHVSLLELFMPSLHKTWMDWWMVDSEKWLHCVVAVSFFRIKEIGMAVTHLSAWYLFPWIPFSWNNKEEIIKQYYYFSPVQIWYVSTSCIPVRLQNTE